MAEGNHTTLKTSGLDLKAAVMLAEASEAAYGAAAVTKAWTAARGFTQHRDFDRGNVQGFWCAEGDVALLVFRGTSNVEQWLRDARFLPTPHPWGWVHEGFKDGIDDVEPDLQGFDPVAAGAKHVWITGHSLGGALSLIAAARLKMRGIPASVYTYGQPRAGLGAFAERYAIELPGRLHRFINQSDVVARVPPSLMGYRHTGVAKRIVRPGVLESAMSALKTQGAFELEVAARVVAVRTATAAGLESAATGLETAGVTLEVTTAATGRGLERAVFESAQAVAGSGLKETMMIDCELPPLTEEEFAQLQLSLQIHKLAPGLEGVVPWIADHAISEYISLLREIRDQ